MTLQRKIFWLTSLCAGLLICMTNQLHAHPLPDGITHADYLNGLKHSWAVAKYEKKGDEQIKAFETLIEDSEHFMIESDHFAEAELWHGTILATYASIKGGVGALKTVKTAKLHLENSIERSATAENGFAHAVLGSLYARVPGWPVSFGSKEKASTHLKIAVNMNPDNIDANYYYGDFLGQMGKASEAKSFLTKALNSQPRKGNELADNGRKDEIRHSLSKIQG